jgi:signal transduction histidine kinase
LSDVREYRARTFPTVDEVARSMAGWIKSTVGGPGVGVRVSLPDPAGRLRVVDSSGPLRDEGRLRSTRRRQAFSEGRPIQVKVRPPGRVLRIVPMLAEGETLGVVEVVGPASRLSERGEALDVAVEQSALLIRAAGEQAEATRAMRGMGSLFGLTSRLMTAETPLEALQIGVELCAEELAVPVAGVRPDRTGAGWYVAAAAAVGSRRRAALRTAAHRAKVHGRRATVERNLVLAFSEAVGWDRAEVVHAGEALLLVAGRSNGRGEFLAAVGALVGEAMSHAGDLRTARSQIEGLDLGIAWTAHELRGPLIGASAALDHVLESAQGPDQKLLLRTREELERLTDLVGPLLRWSAGSRTLEPRKVDLLEIVRAAVEICTLEHPEQRIAVDLPSTSVPVQAEARQLCGAIANVLRNALIYSPASASVRVVVQHQDDVVSVCVTDRGPGIAPEERDLIFDPFARGAAGQRVRSGTGLGLFIARRVAQAHGGSLRLLPTRVGATFCLELSVASEGRSASAS